MGGGGLLTWHMIDGFSVFFFLLVLVIGGVVERRRRRMVFNTAGAGGEECLSSVCVLEKKTNSLCILGSLTQRGSRACVKNVQVHKGATELRNGKQMCLGMRTRYECGEMW